MDIEQLKSSSPPSGWPQLVQPETFNTISKYIFQVLKIYYNFKGSHYSYINSFKSPVTVLHLMQTMTMHGGGKKKRNTDLFSKAVLLPRWAVGKLTFLFLDCI